VIPSLIGFNKSYASDPMLIDINPGSSSDPSSLVNFNGTLYFLSDSESNGSGLWKSDGTLAGTSLVKSINFYNSTGSLAAVGNTLYIYAYGDTGDELWKSDGTTAGTVLLKSGFSSLYTESTQLNGKFIFWADDGVNGKEPWVSDGTTAGTVLLKDVVPGSGSSIWGTRYSAATSNKLFFMDNNQLLVTDGTVAGTTVLASGFTENTYLTALGESVYFWPDERTLWTSDGTAAGTKTVMTVGETGYEYYMVNFKNTLYFWYDDSNFQLWKSDGTSAGTTFLYNTPYSFTANAIGNMLTVGDYFYFVAADNAWSYGEELWKTDFTLDGTSMVKDIYPGSSSSEPIYLVNIGNTLYFSASVASWENFLWQSDGTSAGTIMTAQTTTTGQSADPVYLTNVDGKLFFSAYGDDYAGPNLYVLNTAPALSSDSSLASLGISGFTMSPAFDSGTTSYTASVDSSVDSVGFTPATTFAGASVSINGVDVTSGNSYQVNLVTGVNNISIVVTAEDTVATSTYNVTITKAPGQVKKSSDSSLSTLGVSSCSISPSFNTGITSYVCSVSSSVTSVDITATTSSPVAEVSIKGTKVTSGKPYRVNVAPGQNKVPVVVTAEDLLTTTTYNITITRAVAPIIENIPASPTLSSLIIPEVTLSPTFDSGTTSYTGSVDSTVESIDITPTPSSTGASITVNGVAVEPGSPYTVELETGTNDIAIVVTEGDPAITSTYNLVITKEAATENPVVSDPSVQDPTTPESSNTILGDVMSVLSISISDIGKAVTQIGKSIVVGSKDVEKAVQELPISEQSSQNITAATLVLVAVSPAVSVGLGSSYTIAYITRFFSMIFAFFGIGRKKRNCGLVYDSVTKEPISNAIVRIYSTDGTLVATEVTNVYGIFETDIESGQYSILAQANNYRFPSMLITGTQDLPYENIYRGGTFNYDSSSAISYSIPVDPLDKSNTEYAGAIARNKLINVSSVLLNIFIVVGLVFSVISYIKLNSTINLTLLLVYIFLIVLGMVMRGQEKYKFGTVTDFMGETKDGIQLGLMETEFNTIYAKRISNEKGKYRFIVPGGDYKLVSLDSQYDINSEKGLVINSNRKVISVSNNLEAIRRT